MCNSEHFNARVENVKRFIDLTNKKHYRNIFVNENGLLCFESYNFVQSCYEIHSLDLICDLQQIIDILLENRIEILMREKKRVKR